MINFTKSNFIKMKNNITQEEINDQVKKQFSEHFNTKDDFGRTTLHQLAFEEKEDFVDLTKLVKLELMLNSEINAQDNDGNTALHLSVLKGKNIYTRILIVTAEINPFVKNNNNETALDIAKKLKNQELIIFLKDAETLVNKQGSYIDKNLYKKLEILN